MLILGICQLVLVPDMDTVMAGAILITDLAGVILILDMAGAILIMDMAGAMLIMDMAMLFMVMVKAITTITPIILAEEVRLTAIG